MVNYDNDVFDVTLFDKRGNELLYTHIATLDRVAEFLAEKCVDDNRMWRATIYGQHYQYGEVDLASIADKVATGR